MTTDRPVRVLIVHDDDSTDALRVALAFEGWEVAAAHTVGAAVRSRFDADIVLLDRSLPGRGGAELTAMRSAGSTAIMVIFSASVAFDDRTAAFAAGADDYIVKPFNVEEVVDRLHALSRRMGLAPTSRRIGTLVLDLEDGTVWHDHAPLPLGSLEIELLRELDRYRGRRFSIGDLTVATAGRGIRIPHDFAIRLLERTRTVLASAGSRALSVEAGGWSLA